MKSAIKLYTRNKVKELRIKHEMSCDTLRIACILVTLTFIVLKTRHQIKPTPSILNEIANIIQVPALGTYPANPL